jgi:hypothetical protein
MLLWWSLGRGNPVVPSHWQATVSVMRVLLCGRKTVLLRSRYRTWIARHDLGLAAHSPSKSPMGGSAWSRQACRIPSGR